MGFPAIAAGIGLAGAGISAYNQISAANQQSSALNASAGLGPLNFLLAQTQANAARKAADRARLEGEYAAEQGKMQGDTALASSQAQAQDAIRAGKIAKSNLQAAAAFGGGNASSADVINNAGVMGGQSRYNALVSLYNGELARNEATYQGQLAKYGANQKASALISQAGNYDTAGLQSLAQSSLDRTNASLIKSNAYRSAAGTLLGQGASLGMGYVQAKGNPSEDLSRFKSFFS